MARIKRTLQNLTLVPALDALRNTALKLLDLKDEVDLNTDECNRLIDRVTYLTSGILTSNTDNEVLTADPERSGDDDEAGVSQLNEAASAILAYAQGLRDARLAQRTVRSEAISKELQHYNRMLDDAYSRYQVDVTLSMRRMMRTSSSVSPNQAVLSDLSSSSKDDIASTLSAPKPVAQTPIHTPGGEQSVTPGIYVIMNAQTHTVMDMFCFGGTDGTGIVGHTSNGGSNQRWSLYPSSAGTYAIENTATNNFLSSVQSVGSSTGFAVVQSHSQPELWTLARSYEPHSFFLSTKSHSGRVLDIYCGKSDNGTPIILQTPNPPHQIQNQLWRLLVTPLPKSPLLPIHGSLSIPEGTYVIVNARTHTVLDMWVCGVEDGTPVVGHRSSGGRNQHWTVSGSAGTGYTIQCFATGNYISTVQTRSGNNGFAIAQSSRAPDLWTFRLGNRFAAHAFFISPRSMPDRYLDLMHSSADDGTAIILQTMNPPAQTVNQMWYLLAL